MQTADEYTQTKEFKGMVNDIESSINNLKESLEDANSQIETLNDYLNVFKKFQFTNLEILVILKI